MPEITDNNINEITDNNINERLMLNLEMYQMLVLIISKGKMTGGDKEEIKNRCKKYTVRSLETIVNNLKRDKLHLELEYLLTKIIEEKKIDSECK